METELRREPIQRRLSEEELSSKINELRQSGRYTPEELRSIMNRLRRSGLYPPKVGPAQGLKDFLRTSESTRRPLFEEESLISKEILQQPGHEPSKVGSMQSKLRAKSVQGAKLDKEQLKDKPTSPPRLPPKTPQTSTSASPSASASRGWGVSRLPVSLDRLPSLDKKITHLERLLVERAKNIEILEEKIAKYTELEAPTYIVKQLELEKGEVKKLRPQIDVLKKEQELRKQYKTEVVAAAPIHVGLTIAQKGHPTFIDTLAICERIMPSLFDDHSLLLGYSTGILARQFKDRAALESKKSGRQISAKELIEREIKYLEGLAPYPGDASLLEHRLASLREAEEALESDQQPVSFSPIPVDAIGQALPQFPGSEGGYGICFQVDEKRRQKITILGQPPTEDQEGSFSFYESYSETNAMVRVAYYYCEVWSSGKFNFSEDPELFIELDKLSDACSRKIRKLCQAKIDGYRLPYCIMFLGAFNDPLMSDGLHIPICLALQSTVMEENQRVLRAEDVQNKSIPYWMFAELFNREMLGSGWLNREWLLDLDKFLMTLLPPGRLIIHIQEYSYPAQGDGTKEAGD